MAVIDVNDITSGSISIRIKCSLCNQENSIHLSFPIYNGQYIPNQSTCYLCTEKLRKIIAKFDLISRL